MSVRLLFSLLCEANHDRLQSFLTRLAGYAGQGEERRHYVAFMAVTMTGVVMEERRDEFRDIIHPWQINDLLKARGGLPSS